VSHGAQARALLRLARQDRDRLLASMAGPPAVVPPYHRVRSATEHLLLCGAARLSRRGARSCPEAIGQAAARVSLELVLVTVPEGRLLPLVSGLERLERHQARSLPALLGRLGDARTQDPEPLLGLAFEALVRLVAALGCRTEPSRLVPLAAEIADYLAVATYGGLLEQQASEVSAPFVPAARLTAEGGI